MKRTSLVQAFFIVAVCVLLAAMAPDSQAQQTTNKPTTKESADSNRLVGSWLVKQVNGQGVVTLDDARPTIEIGSDSSVTGSTGINQFEGIATIDGQALTISRKVKTLLAGPQALMNQQSNFIAALREVRSFHIDDKGTLHMLNGAGAELINASPANQPDSVPTPNDSEEQEKASPVKVDFQLSTHVLDTSIGKPGVGVKVILEKRHQDGTWLKVGESVTNKQGRIGNFLASIESGNNHGTYRLTFALEDYFKASNQKTVFPEAVVVFKIEDDTHYHIPVVVTPYAISTYRGS